MRTTLTLDPDVSAELEALRRKQGLTLKEAINSVLRQGLRAMAERNKCGPDFATRSVDLEPSLLPLDDVTAAVAAAEGDTFR